MALQTLDPTEDRNFRDGETIWDVDGNAYTVRGPCAVLNLNDNIVNNLNEPGMRECFTRIPPGVTVKRGPVVLPGQTPSGLHSVTVHISDTTPSWLRSGQRKGFKTVTVTSHEKTKYIEFDCTERDIEKQFSKRTMVGIPEGAGRAVYEMLKEIYG